MNLIDLDELTGETEIAVNGIVRSWGSKPVAKWPVGTKFEDLLGRGRWVSATSIAKLPNGHWYVLLLSGKEEDPRKVPPILYRYAVARIGGDVFAYPRVANMKCGPGWMLGASESAVDAEKYRVWRGAELGLEERYRIGSLNRGLRHRTRTVSDGWE